MILTLLKYLSISITVYLSFNTLYTLLISRPAFYGISKYLLVMTWLGYLAILLILAGIIYYKTQDILIWQMFKISLLAGVVVWSLIFGINQYNSYRGKIEHQKMKDSETAHKNSVIKAYKKNPKNPKNLVAMGNQAPYAKDNKYDKYPTDYYKEAIDIDPKYIDAYKELIYLIQNMRLRDDLEQGYADDKGIYPRVAKEFAQRVLEMDKQGELKLTDENRAFFIKAVEHANEWLESIEDIKKAQHKNFKAYLDEATAKINKNPKDPIAWAKRAGIYHRYYDDFDSAYNDIKKALELNPDIFEVQNEYACYLKAIRLCKDAIEAYQKAIKLDSDKGTYLKYRIEECQKSLEWANGRDLYTKEFYSNYFYKSYNQLYKSEVKKEFEKDPNNPKNLVKMGLIQNILKDKDGNIEDKGIAYYEKSIKLIPSYIEAYKYLSTAYYLSHKYEKVQKLSFYILKKVKNSELKLTNRDRYFFIIMINYSTID